MVDLLPACVSVHDGIQTGEADPAEARRLRLPVLGGNDRLDIDVTAARAPLPHGRLRLRDDGRSDGVRGERSTGVREASTGAREASTGVRVPTYTLGFNLPGT